MCKAWWICSGLLVLSYLITVNGQAPEIAKEILPVIKRVGETGILNCTVTRQGDSQVFWIYTKTSLTITVDDSLYVDEGLNKIIDGNRKYDITVSRNPIGDTRTYSLIIRRLQRDDAGEYTCKVHLKDNPDNDAQKNGKMIVLMAPTILRGTATQTVKTDIGGTAQLTCDAEGYPQPKITWVRGNGMLLPEPVKKTRFKGSVLNLTNIQSEDSGVYRCLANNDVNPPASLDTTLYVEYPPVAKAVQDTYGQAQNRQFRLTIECIITGFPEPDLQWYQQEKSKAGWKPVSNDDKHEVNVLLSHGGSLSVNAYWFQLDIINVQANDYTNYRCVGKNRKGESYATINVYETSECQGANCPPEVVLASANSHQMSGLVVSLLLVLWICFTA